MIATHESPAAHVAAPVSPKLVVEALNLYYGDFQALRDIHLTIPATRITAIIGPSGCGKSSLLRCLNRMNELIEHSRVTGRVLLDGQDIMQPDVQLIALRQRVGMVFQRPNPFPLSVQGNITFGPQIHGLAARRDAPALVERCLRAVGLWEDLRDRLRASALALSLEQQQRLCIARAIATEPEVLLLDEPCSALDPVATAKIEELLHALKQRYTIVIVTHNMQQAARASDYTGFMLLGDLIECGPTGTLFTTPRDQRTEDYITGRFG